MRGLTILDVDCAYAPGDPNEEIITKPIVIVRILNDLRLVTVE